MTQGKRIRAIRQLRGYSPKELGIRAGMSPKSAGSRIARYEDGRCVPRKETLFRIAKALNVSPMAVAPYTGRDPREILEILFWLEEAGKMDGIMEVRDLMAMMDVWEAIQSTVRTSTTSSDFLTSCLVAETLFPLMPLKNFRWRFRPTTYARQTLSEEVSTPSRSRVRTR